MALSNYFLNRANMLFLLALICGMILPQGFPVGYILILPALMLSLTITLLKFPRGFFRQPGPLLSATIRGNVMNYLVLGNFIILASIFLIRKQELWLGMILLAAVPPSVAIIPLGNLLRIDKTAIFTGLAGSYLGALLIIPLIGLGFLKYIQLSYWNLILLALGLILLPLAMSRLAVEKVWDKIIGPYEDIISDCCFFIVFYTITASSRNLLMNWSFDILIIAIIAFVSTFFFAFAIVKIGHYFHDPENKITSFILLGTMKDCGLAGGIALTLFNQEAALPALIFAIFTFLYTNWLKYKMRHIIEDLDNKEKILNTNLTN